MRELVDEVRTVTEEDLSRALLFCLERAKLVVEPAGVAAVAAVLADPAAFPPPVVAVVSGGNIDPVLLLKVVQHGMAAAGRYLSLRLRVPDRPGSLAAVLAELAAVGANVLEVEHERTDTRLHVGEVEVFVVLETRGPDHAEEVAAALTRAGYAVTAELMRRRPAMSSGGRAVLSRMELNSARLAAPSRNAVGNCHRSRPSVPVMTDAIVVEGLVKRFGATTALDGVDLTVAEGSVLGLLGPNGAGKTTVVRILTTLLRADAGRARWWASTSCATPPRCAPPSGSPASTPPSTST